MKMNRRNVLIGIGTAAVGSGAVLGSGALTQVSASRTVNVTTAGDSSANVGIIPDTDAENAGYISTVSGNNNEDVVQIDLNNLNDDAETTINPIFTIDNNLGSGVGVTVRSDGYASGSEVPGLTVESVSSEQNLADQPTANGDDHNLEADGTTGETVDVKLTIDTTNFDPSSVNNIVIEADTSLYTA